MNEHLPTHVTFWLNEAEHDCCFVVGPERGPTERIGALKLFLIGHSEPFRVMFGSSELAEKGDVRVTDVEPETFKTFLKCVYGGSDLVIPNLTFKSSAKLLYVAEKYLVHDLKVKIVNHLSKSLSPETLLLFLEYPICLKSETLEKEILIILQSEFHKIVMNSRFLKLSTESLLWIVQQRDLKVYEIELWNIVLKWAMHRTNSTDGKVLRSRMFPLLKHIRFLTMGFKEFCQYVVPNDVLTKEEVYDICKSFGTTTPPNFEHLCNSRNSRNPKICQPAMAKLSIKFLNHSDHVVVLASVDIRDLKEMEFSQPFKFNNCLWSIGAWKRKDDRLVNHLILYLKCEISYPEYRCGVSGEFSVLHDSDESFTKYFGHTLNTVNNTCSVRFSWAQLFQDGYIIDRRIVVMARFIGFLERNQ